MKKFKTPKSLKVLCLSMLGIFFINHSQAQILSGLLNSTFDEITVNKRAVFSGEVQLNQGLWLNGRAQLSDGLTSIGGMDVTGDIVFNGLSLASDLSENALLVIDPQGIIRRMSGFETIQNAIENRAIDFQYGVSMPELSVLQQLNLAGAVDLGEDVIFRGDAAFADDVRISQNLNVTEEIRSATATIDNLEVNERLRIGAMAYDSTLGTAAFVGTNTSGELMRFGGEQLELALGPVLTPRPSTCLTTPNGDAIPRWNYDVNKIVIDDCSRGTANVGLGTLNPTAKLDVIGSVKSRGLEIERGNALIRGTRNFAAVADEAYLYLGDTEHSIMAKRGTGVSLSTFGNPNGLVLSEVNGGVGIGIGEDVPQAQLHIKGANQNLIYVESTLADANNPNSTQRFKVTANGKTYTNEVNVQLNDFPDYVFEQDYSLMPLSQLKQSIKENHKLPNMPSAKEVEEKGADLGEITRVLVEKVEELTLYIIQLEEQVEELKAKE